MTGIEAVGAVGLNSAQPVITQLGFQPIPGSAQQGQISFGDMLASGMQAVEAKVANANDMVRRFTLDDSMPLHQVTFALEEARLSVELAMQIRGRLMESYRELMSMQL